LRARAPPTTRNATGDAHPEDWDLAGLGEALFQQFDVRIPPAQFMEVATREGVSLAAVALPTLRALLPIGG